MKKLLLHACCAPCSSYVLLALKEKYDVTLYFSNDNIWPEKEYDLRLEELRRFAKEFNIPVIDDGFEPKDFYQAIKGFERSGEKSLRCYFCYNSRLAKTAKKAKELGFDLFSTTLSISPYKVVKWLNEIGEALEAAYGVEWLHSDFREGYERSLELCEEYGLYQQDYCGCCFSYSEVHGGKNK